MSLSDTKISES